ncbi:2Fe-2S iron-sulfur cluster-binding protein [Nocardia sp. NPDC001965]|uniref:2Fe-2S iron-sulfur cluster-binding protein n=1 Tax=Nocardia sp. NPDC050799 TaxID=3154842 RepID=UPI0033E8D088
MDWVEKAVTVSCSGLPDHGEPSAGGCPWITIRCDRRTVTGSHRKGATILQMARFLGIDPPATCETGHCGACTARVVSGVGVEMRHNEALSEAEVAAGWVLTCQALPTRGPVRVVYE